MLAADDSRSEWKIMPASIIVTLSFCKAGDCAWASPECMRWCETGASLASALLGSRLCSGGVGDTAVVCFERRQRKILAPTYSGTNERTIPAITIAAVVASYLRPPKQWFANMSSAWVKSWRLSETELLKSNFTTYMNKCGRDDDTSSKLLDNRHSNTTILESSEREEDRREDTNG